MDNPSPLKKVFNNSVFFSIGTLATKAISFFMLPVYTYCMSDTEYGKASTILAFISTFSLLVLLGTRAAILRFYVSFNDKEKKSRFVGSVFTVILLNGLLFLLLAVIFKDFLVHFLFTDMEFYPLVFMGVLSLIPEALYYAYQSILQAEQRGKSYTANSIAYMLLYAGLNLIFVLFIRMGALGMTIGMLFTPTIMSAAGIIRLIRRGEMKFCLDTKILKPVLRYSLPIVPHDLSATLATYISKIFLNKTVSYAATGLYTVASQISTIISLVQTSLNLAFHPWFYEQMEKGEEGRKNIKSFSVFIFIVYCYMSLLIVFFSQEVIAILTPEEYREAWKIVPIMTIALVVNFIYYTHVLTIFYNIKASRFIAVCSVSGALFNIIAAYFLVPAYNSMGAALAYFVSKCFTALITVVYSRRVQKVDFGLSKMIVFLFVTAALMLVGLSYSIIFNSTGFDIKNIAFKLVLTVLITAVLVIWKKDTIIKYIGIFKK